MKIPFGVQPTLSCIAMEIQNGVTPLENILAVSYKVK